MCSLVNGAIRKSRNLLELFELSECMVSPEQVKELSVPQIDYQIVHERIAMARSCIEMNSDDGRICWRKSKCHI